MARILIVATHGYEDPTRAGLAFFMARGAVEAGHRPEVVLAGDGAILAHRGVAEAVVPVGIPPLRELVASALENEVPIHT